MTKSKSEQFEDLYKTYPNNKDELEKFLIDWQDETDLKAKEIVIERHEIKLCAAILLEVPFKNLAAQRKKMREELEFKIKPKIIIGAPGVIKRGRPGTKPLMKRVMSRKEDIELRRQRIYDKIVSTGSAGISGYELTSLFEIKTNSVKHDLIALKKQNKIKNLHNFKSEFKSKWIMIE
jgi:hypothetical protein